MRFLIYLLGLLAFADLCQAGETDLKQLVKIPSESDGLIQLPLRVHLVTGLEMEQKGVKMDMWVTTEMFETKILPEVNRIWKPAKIQWVLESLKLKPAIELSDHEQRISYILESNRQGKYPERTTHILKFSGVSRKHPVVNNLYLFPYIGQTYQGFASLNGNQAVTAVWTDKPFGATKPPIKSKLTEDLPFQIGSIGRTVAHELGHNLGLKHPDKSTQKRFNRIMGGKKQGYQLVPEEIEQARKVALKRAHLIMDWVNR